MKKLLFDFLRQLIKLFIPEFIICHFTVDKVYGRVLTKLVPNHYQYSNSSFRSIRRNGINYRLDISDLIGWYIYFGFKEKSKENLINIADKNHIVLDVGSNIGEIALRLAKKVQPNGRVFAFEPSRHNFDELMNNISLNLLTNISPFREGLGEDINKLTLYTIDSHNKGKSRISSNKELSKKSEVIKVNSIDNFVGKNKIDCVDLIKIDTEGYEMKVLKGALQTLKNHRPNLFIEVNNGHLKAQGSSTSELFSFLINLNYNLFESSEKQPIVIDRNYDKMHFDIIATPKSSQ